MLPEERDETGPQSKCANSELVPGSAKGRDQDEEYYQFEA